MINIKIAIEQTKQDGAEVYKIESLKPFSDKPERTARKLFKILQANISASDWDAFINLIPEVKALNKINTKIRWDDRDAEDKINNIFKIMERL